MKNKGIAIAVITVLLILAQFIGNYGNYQLAAIPGQIIQAYNLSELEFSSLMTAPLFPSIFLSIAIGAMVDRFGLPKMLGICFALAAVGFVLRLFATDYVSMLVAMALSGLGCMAINANLGKIASSLYPMDKVSTMVGILMAASTASMAVAFGTTAFIPTIEIAFWITVVVSLVVAVLWILLVRQRNFDTVEVPEGMQIPIKESLAAGLRSRSVWLAGIALFCILGGAMVTSNFQVLALTSLSGFDEAYAGSFGSVLMIGSIVGSILVPLVAQKLGRGTPWFLLVCGLVAAACEFGIVSLPPAGIYACSFLNGALRSGIMSVIFALPVLFPEIGPKYAGTAGGLISTIELLGAVIIPTYVIVPLGAGDMVMYFVLGTAFMAAGALVSFIMAQTCGAYAKKEA